MIGAGALGQQLTVCRSNELWQSGAESQVRTRERKSLLLDPS